MRATRSALGGLGSRGRRVICVKVNQNSSSFSSGTVKIQSSFTNIRLKSTSCGVILTPLRGNRTTKTKELFKVQKRKFWYQSNEPIVPVLGNAHEGGHPVFYYVFLIGLNVAIFLLWNSTEDTEFMTRNFAVNIENLKQGRVWTTITAAFSHQSPEHILGNMIALVLFGYKTYKALGFAALTGLYLIGGFAASIGHCVLSYGLGRTQPRLPDAEVRRWEEKIQKAPSAEQQKIIEQVNKECENRDIPSLGASGSVMAIAAVAATLFPRDKILFRNIPLPMPLAVGMYMGSDLLGLANWRTDSVSHAGHLAGALVGLAYSVILWYGAGKRGGHVGQPLPLLRWIGARGGK